MIEFAEPVWLVVGVVVCAALGWLVAWAARKRRVALEVFASRRLLGGLTAGVSEGRRRAKVWLLMAGVACLFVALARPQWGSRWEEVTRRGIDILLAVDTSRSMLAPDVAPNRLERAKLGIYDFVQKLEGDRVGLMPFAGQAFLLCPLTMDYGAFGESLQAVNTAIVPEGGTDIALAIETAERAFEKGASHKILVLITDGEDLEGEAIEAAKSAAENGVTIHTVGVGTPNGELIPLGGAGYVKDEGGEAVKSRLDEVALGEIAELTGGVYAALGGRGEGLETIYREKLMLVPEEELSQRMKEVKTERFQWPLALGVLLLVAEYLVRGGKRREVAGGAVGVKPTAVVVVLVVGVLVAMSGRSEAGVDPRAGYNTGTEEYAAGDWAGAEASFRGALDTGDVGLQGRAYYNLGNTLYRKGEAAQEGEAGKEATVEAWEAAVEAFDNVLALDAEDEDAAFNKEFVEKKLEALKGEEQQDQDQDQDQDKDQEQKDQDKDQEDQGKDGEKDQKPEEGDEGEKQPDEEGGDAEKNEDGKDKGEGKEAGDKEGEGREDEKEEEGEGEKQGGANENAESGEPAGGEAENEEDEKKEDAGEQAGEKPADQQARPAQAARVPGEMSKEEAVQLLRSMLDEEGAFQAIPYSLSGTRKRSTGRVKRDW